MTIVTAYSDTSASLKLECPIIDRKAVNDSHIRCVMLKNDRDEMGGSLFVGWKKKKLCLTFEQLIIGSLFPLQYGKVHPAHWLKIRFSLQKKRFILEYVNVKWTGPTVSGALSTDVKSSRRVASALFKFSSSTEEAR